MATFPLLGDKTAVYLNLFWADRFPQYLRWGLELLERIKDSADVTLAITDHTINGALPDHVDAVELPKGTRVRLRTCFQAAVNALAERDVGAFYYIGADNLHDRDGVRDTLASCMADKDVTFADYILTKKRFDDVVFPAPRTHVFKFNLDVHTWPDSACFRTSIFKEFPLSSEPREFIRHTLKAAAEAGKSPEAAFVPDKGFYYFQHDRSDLDRTFIQGG